MKKYTEEELKVILEAHAKWLEDGTTGAWANLEDADLSGMNLSGANLAEASLVNANLKGANLSGTNFLGAYLVGANLQGANLSCANLSVASLEEANLRGANLSGANLYCATLKHSDLQHANMQGANLKLAFLAQANLQGANLKGTKLSIILPAGKIEGWKKCRNNVIVRLSIPAEARRSCATSTKCRAEYVDVLEVIGSDVGISNFAKGIEYRVGQRVKCDTWEKNRWKECAGGIHFFLTKKEAEEYQWRVF